MAKEAIVMTAAKLEDQIREALAPHLEAGEELRVVGGFQSGGNWGELPKATFFTMRNWWVGITDRRAILAKQGRLSGKLLEDAVYTVPRENIVVKGRRTLRVKSPDPKVPKYLRFLGFSGFDKDEFTQALAGRPS